MTTKIIIDPALVREVLNKYIDASKSIMLYASYGEELWEENKDAIVQHSLNIHEFKDLAIEWCAGKGYLISPSVISLDGLKIEIHKAHRHVNDDYSPHNWYMSSYLVEYFMHRKYPNKLSAELAAIDFVYKQIQKEKKDEN